VDRYLDASVILRRVMGQQDALAEFASRGRERTSALTEIECLRTLDRRFLTRTLDADALAAARIAVYQAIEATDVVEITPAILRRAGGAFPTPLGTLDAIHLATALEVAEELGNPMGLATHDRELARCARACGLDVTGV
jgi:predicted nucleic acid-binding protein